MLFLVRLFVLGLDLSPGPNVLVCVLEQVFSGTVIIRVFSFLTV